MECQRKNTLEGGGHGGRPPKINKENKESSKSNNGNGNADIDENESDTATADSVQSPPLAISPQLQTQQVPFRFRGSIVA